MSEIIAWLAEWYNWPFLLTLGVGIVFILADLALGGISDMIGLDADADVDVDVDVDASVESGTLGFDADGPDPDVAASWFGGLLMSGLAWIGLGKVPISVLLEVMLITFGVVGLLVNAVVVDLVPAVAPYAFPLALVAACAVAPVITRLVGGTIASIIPADATTSRKPGDFVGEVGTTASIVTSTIGQVRLSATDKHPQTILNARCDATVPQDLPRDVEVLLASYDPQKNIYIIVPIDSLES